MDSVTGTVKKINLDRRFGFITRDDGGPDVFFHQSDMVKGWPLLVEGKTKVRFAVVSTDKGPRAAAIALES